MSKFSQSVSKIEVEVDKPSRMIILGFDRQPLRDVDGSVNYIDLYSSDSEIARKLVRTATNRRLAMRGRGKMTASEMESNDLELLVGLTAGWGSIAKDSTVTPDADFTAQAARELYANPRNSELRGQVDEFAADRGNFSTALSTNSSNTPNTNGDKAAS